MAPLGKAQAEAQGIMLSIKVNETGSPIAVEAACGVSQGREGIGVESRWLWDRSSHVHSFTSQTCTEHLCEPGTYIPRTCDTVVLGTKLPQWRL